MSSTTAADSYINSENRRVDAANGTTFAYRDLGRGDVALAAIDVPRGSATGLNLENDACSAWEPSTS